MVAKTLRVKGKEETAFPNRAAFIKAIKENPSQVEYRNSSSVYDWRDFDAKSIFNKIYSSDEYKRRKEFIEMKSEQEKRKVRTKIAIVEGEKQALQKKPLRLLINRDNKNEVFDVIYKNALDEEEKFEAVKRSPYFELIQYLIRRGYIDESYPDYMTYFYENSISANDKKFLRGVLGEKAEAYDYALVNPHRVIEELELRHFTQEETLNFDLLDCLLEDSVKYREQLNTFLHRIYVEEPAGFVAGYLQRGKNRRLFILHMNREWQGTCNWILTEERFEAVRPEYVTDMLCVSTDEFIVSDINKENLKNYLEENIAAISVSDDTVTKIMHGITLLNVKVKRIDHEVVNAALLAEIYKYNAYELSANMVEVVLEYFYGLRPEDIDWESNLSQIFADANAPLCRYVKGHIAEYLKVIQGQAVTILDKEEVVLYVLNEESIVDEDKHEYIKGLMTTITSLEEVKDVTLWPLLLQAEVVAESSKNMCDYYFKSEKGLDENLIRYINNSESDLKVNSSNLDSIYGENSRWNMHEDVIKCKELCDAKYESLIVSFKYYYTDFELRELSLNKLNILIDTDIVRMTEANLKFLRTEYPDAIGVFIRHNLESYVELVQSKGIIEQDELIYLLEEYPTAKAKVKEEIVILTVQNLDYVMQEELPVNIELLKKVLANEQVEKDVCKELIAVYLPNMSREKAILCLKAAGLDKFHSVFSGKRPSFERSEANKKLLQVMGDCGLISSFGEDKQNPGYYKAYGKRKSI